MGDAGRKELRMTYLKTVQENVIEFERNDKTATVTFCRQKFISRIRKLAEKYPDECEIVAENKDGSIMAHIPVKWIRISNLSRNLTEEQRAEAAERMRSRLDNARKESNSDFNDSDEDLSV